MITFETISKLEQATLKEDDLVRVLGEFKEGDVTTRVGKVRVASYQTSNRKINLPSGMFVEIMPDATGDMGATVNYVNQQDDKVKVSVNNLHTKREAIKYIAGLEVTDPLQLYVHEGVEYLPKSSEVPFTTGVSFDDNFFNIAVNKIISLKTVFDATLMKVGQRVSTDGFYSPFDGGAGEYEIVTTDDNGICVKLADNKYLKPLIKNNKLNLRQIGMKSDDANFDNTSIFNSAAIYSASSGVSISSAGIFYFKGADGIKLNGSVLFESDGILSNVYRFTNLADRADAVTWSGSNTKLIGVRVEVSNYKANGITVPENKAVSQFELDNVSVGGVQTEGLPVNGAYIGLNLQGNFFSGKIGYLRLDRCTHGIKTKGYGQSSTSITADCIVFNFCFHAFEANYWWYSNLVLAPDQCGNDTYADGTKTNIKYDVDPNEVPVVINLTGGCQLDLNVGYEKCRGVHFRSLENDVCNLNMSAFNGTHYTQLPIIPNPSNIGVKEQAYFSIGQGSNINVTNCNKYNDESPSDYPICYLDSKGAGFTGLAFYGGRAFFDNYKAPTGVYADTVQKFLKVYGNTRLRANNVPITHNHSEEYDELVVNEVISTKAMLGVGSLKLSGGGGGTELSFAGNNINPKFDNSTNLGAANLRFKSISLANAPSVTSDERLKTGLSDIDDKLKRVARSINIKKFKYTERVEKKGDKARIHFGVSAQEVIAAFAAEGLDAFNYACVRIVEWDAEDAIKDDSGEVIIEAVDAGSRLEVVLDELLALKLAVL